MDCPIPLRCFQASWVGQSRTYAVMAMTTSEMRSSGGLIGSIGEMTADNGVIHIGDFNRIKHT
ncbi:DUF4012 domain-containing protein [Bifidobacterium canis]|uniref:DUF4012 domain-containing protein n=1 Tax=Bifidobacterium canis TaxID=2610880 RepID=UPI0012D9B801